LTTPPKLGEEGTRKMTKIHNINKLTGRRKSLRNRSTSEEIFLWTQLKNSKTGFKFRRQHSIGGYITDFYCAQKRLVIEIDGSQHSKKENKELDKIRTDFFAGLNIKVLRFTNEEVATKTSFVLKKIEDHLASIN
jgi:very-short-patch-repair endonuclease